MRYGSDPYPTGCLLAVLAPMVFLAVGWVLNLIEIVQTFAWPPDGMMVLRIAGVFLLPLGGVLGWF